MQDARESLAQGPSQKFGMTHACSAGVWLSLNLFRYLVGKMSTWFYQHSYRRAFMPFDIYLNKRRNADDIQAIQSQVSSGNSDCFGCLIYSASPNGLYFGAPILTNYSGNSPRHRRRARLG
jgi:hypothetical protein